MTLVNSLLALGTLAFTIPLAIHLLYRSRFVTVDWGAMHLLGSVMQVNRRRLQWTHWLLLFLRCLIPVLLALGLARPVLTGFRALAGDAPQSWVLVIDDSRSMAARGASGEPRIERAKQQLIATLGGLSRHDEVFVVPASGAERPAGAMGPLAAIDALRAIRAETGPVDLASLLSAALRTAEAASHPHRQIVLVSDFQSHLVDDALFDSLGRLAAESQQSEPPPVISLWDVGGESDQLKNVSVEALRVESPAVIAGRPTEYAARIRNASDTAAAAVRVQWSIDGARLDPQTVTLPARSSRTVRMRRAIAEPGVHEVALAVEVGDALPEDNRRRLAVDVIHEVGVLLVDGAPSARPLESETDFLAIALSPFAFGQHQQRSDAVRTRVVSPTNVAEQLDAQPWDVVVLANVPAVDAGLERALVQFIHRGGALVVFDGDSLRRRDYNRRWTSGQLAMELPARLGPRVGDPPRPGEAAERGDSAMQIGQLAGSFPAWSVLGDDQQRPLASVEVFAYRKLQPRGEPANAPPASADGERARGDAAAPVEPRDGAAAPADAASTVLMRMVGGDPLVVSARRGLGQVVQFAIPCDTAWSTLPLRPAFLPMMQQLVLHLAGTQSAATSMTGEPLVVPLSEFEAAPAKPSGGKTAGEAVSPAAYRYSVQPPTGRQRRLEPTRDLPARLIHPLTSAPGVYRIRRTAESGGEGGRAASTIRVVEVPAQESQLRDVEPARLAALAEGLGASVYRDAASFRGDDHRRRFGREIWRWLLAALVAVMVAEVGLQQYTLRRSRAGVTG